jgi:hypothetical protein
MVPRPMIVEVNWDVRYDVLTKLTRLGVETRLRRLAVET